MDITFGSLFAGIGGMDLGLERAGFECKWQVEIDDYANQVLRKHWPNVSRWHDVQTFPPRPTKEWKVDLICGGFPCQDISYAGKGAGLEGDRSGLFFEALRVVRQLRPRYVLLENVAALLSRGLDRVCGELAQIGYDCEWHCIPAAAVGAPHIRDRVFVLGHADSESKPIGTLNGGTPRMPKLDVYADSERWKRQKRIGSTGSQGQPDRHVSQCDWWAVEPDVGRVANGVPRRVDRLRCLGNAVVPQVAEYIGQQIMKDYKSTAVFRGSETEGG